MLEREWYEKIIMNGEEVQIWKNVVIPRYSFGESEENRQNVQS
jgi:hypothetical protein